MTDFTQYILRDKNGNEIKEWYAWPPISPPLARMDCRTPMRFPTAGRDVSRSWNPIELLKRPNWITLAAVLVLVLAVVLVVFLVRHIRAGRRRRRYGGGYRNRRWFGR